MACGPKFASHAKADPGKLSYGHVGVGVPHYLTMECIADRGRAHAVHGSIWRTGEAGLVPGTILRQR